MAKKKSGSLTPTLDKLGDALSEVLEDITAEVYEAADRGLDKAAEYMKDKLEAATPIESGATRGMWVINFKYRNVRYINNLRLNDKGIPVVNLLEFGSRGKPFVRKTVDAEQDNIVNIVKKEIENGK